MQEGNVLTSENSAEFYAAKLNITPANPPAEAVEKTEPVVETPSGEEATEQKASATEADDQHKQNPKLQERFDKLTKQREEAKRATDAANLRAEAAERRAADLEAKLNPPKAVDANARPQANQFNDAFEYAEALADWSSKNALKVRDQEERKKAWEAEQQKMLTSWEAKQAEFQAQNPDYKAMLASSDVVVSDPIRDAIIESDIGPKILYHLAEHPEIAASLSSKSVVSSLRELGKLEAKLSEDKPAVVESAPKLSNAPPPIKPIKGNNATSDNLIDSDGNFIGTYAQFKALSLAGKI